MGKAPSSDPKDVGREAAVQRSLRGLGTGMRVRIKGKTAVVSGTVVDYETKRRVYSIVQDSPGIEKVTNHVRVMPS